LLICQLFARQLGAFDDGQELRAWLARDGSAQTTVVLSPGQIKLVAAIRTKIDQGVIHPGNHSLLMIFSLKNIKLQYL
jgi:hypothetical protein